MLQECVFYHISYKRLKKDNNTMNQMIKKIMKTIMKRKERIIEHGGPEEAPILFGNSKAAIDTLNEKRSSDEMCNGINGYKIYDQTMFLLKRTPGFVFYEANIDCVRDKKKGEQVYKITDPKSFDKYKDIKADYDNENRFIEAYIVKTSLEETELVIGAGTTSDEAVVNASYKLIDMYMNHFKIDTLYKLGKEINDAYMKEAEITKNPIKFEFHEN